MSNKVVTICEYGARAYRGAREFEEVGVKAEAVSLDGMKYDPAIHDEAMASIREAGDVYVFVDRDGMASKYPQIAEIEAAAAGPIKGPKDFWTDLTTRVMERR